MDNQREQNSSYLATLPMICVNLLAGVLFAYFKQKVLAIVFMLIFLLGLFAFLWARAVSKNLFIDFSYSATGLFPGENLIETIEIRNKKFLPVIWMSINDCLTEEFSVPSLLWHEEISVQRNWLADKRGVKNFKNRAILTGDGFGLRQDYIDDNITGVSSIAVYPKRVKVNPKIFMKNLWNASSGKNGTIEDVTVIKSTRGYQTSDAARNINWRLAARNQPLSVNVYETIQPRGVHFIFDGESFSGHSSELEDALSIIGSELIELNANDFASGLSVCKGKESDAVTLGCEENLFDMLYCLAAYEFEDTKWNGEEKIEPKAEFLNEDIAKLSGSVGHYYYVCYEASAAAKSSLLNVLSEDRVTLLTFKEGGGQWLENIKLQTLLA